MKTYNIYLLFACLWVISCSPKHYVTSSYQELAPSHQTVAILPFENIFTGRQSDKLSDEDLLDQLESEAYVFQRSLYHQVLRQSKNGDRGIQIRVLDLKKTNKILSDKFPTYTDIISATNEELSQALEVDAVVRVVVHKDQFFSAGERVGISVARDVLSANSIRLPLAVLGSTNDDNVQIFASIVDGPTETAVWSLEEKCHITWSTNANEIVESINNKISRKFPYRKGL